VSENPITVVFPEALSPLRNLRVLSANGWKLRYPETDLAFLKRVESTLNRLSLDNSFPKGNLDKISMLKYLKMPELDNLSLKGAGLLCLSNIDKMFPNLVILEL